MKICRNLTFLSRLRQISRLKVVVILLFAAPQKVDTERWKTDGK